MNFLFSFPSTGILRILKSLLIILLLVVHAGLHGQGTFNPDERLVELHSDGGNVGITAGYSVDGEIKWTGSEGFACEDDRSPFSTTTLTRIASISKNFTAVAIMQLVEQDLVSLDDPIVKYLPELPDDKRMITVRQLMAHTAGIPQYQNKKEMENEIHYASLEEAMAVFIDRPLLFEPGSSYFYTTYGYVVLGRIIESVANMRYSEYMKANLFDKAGMDHTDVEEIREVYPNKSCLYHKSGRKKVREGNQNDLSNRIPGGGFYSTLEDLIRFGNALVDGRLITLESLDILRQPQDVAYDGNKYGLGWYLYGPAPYENLVIGHSGGQTGCSSQLMIVPKTKTVVVVLSNTSGTYPDIASLASGLITFSEQKVD